MKTTTKDKIIAVGQEVIDLLIEKNESYGDSALEPANIFADGDAVQNLSARIDDKLMRIKTKGFDGYEEDGRQFEKSNDGVWLRDHLHFNKPHTGKIPSKPKELYDVLIKCYCPKGGLVLEPFSGSGNFAISCINQSKQYIGSEIDNNVYEYSINNIKNHFDIQRDTRS